MAKAQRHVYKIPKTHPIGIKLKKGGLMRVHMKKVSDAADSDGMDHYEEVNALAEQASAPTPGAPTNPPGSKSRKAVDYLKERRRVVT